MDIESISGAATIALASTLLFVLIAKSWQLLNRTVGSAPPFPDAIMREAAQRFRDEFERLTTTQATYLSAGLVFLVLFAAAYILNAERLFAGYPRWQLYLLLAALSAGAVLVGLRLSRIVWHRHEVRLLRDANIAIGHQLQRVASGLGRAYHDVETSAGVIDHVIIGPHGAYAVNVIARAGGRDGTIGLDGSELVFEPGGKTLSIVETGERIASLEREFRRLVDHRVRVRSVIAIPGWEINRQGSDDHLLVNERNLPMLSGWKDKTEYLMNEDVDALYAFMNQRCRRSPGSH